jgi:NAD(P)-dependent dehydrogenase (short-subunit alcohol dehydrogenase family)
MTTTVDLEGGCVIVTGGTRGLGKAIGMEFGRADATVFLTHRWGSVDEDELRAEFETGGIPKPRIIESDASDPEAARDLMNEVAKHPTPLVAVVSGVAFAQVVDSITDLNRKSLELSLRYSTWPVLDLVHAAKERLGYYPRYVIALSSDGGFVCHPGYDMVGIAKAALETLCRYLAVHLRGEGVRVNAVRSGALDTASARATFGVPVEDTDPIREQGLILDPHSVARACVALCSGLMDSVSGQVITVDEGISLFSPVVRVTGRGGPGPLPPAGSGGKTK